MIYATAFDDMSNKKRLIKVHKSKARYHIENEKEAPFIVKRAMWGLAFDFKKKRRLNKEEYYLFEY
jgi:hypothetical protein